METYTLTTSRTSFTFPLEGYEYILALENEISTIVNREA